MRKPESANCHYCYRLLRRDHITFDHMTPKIAGGKRNRGNLVVACPLCNLCKGHTHYTIFLIQISFVPVDASVPLEFEADEDAPSQMARPRAVAGARKSRDLRRSHRRLG